MLGPKKFSATFKVEKPDFARKKWTRKLEKGFERKEDVNGKYTVYSNKYLKTSIQATRISSRFPLHAKGQN